MDRHGGRGGAAPAESIGGYLAAQRQMRGISVEALAEATRIPIRSLKRLEAGTFDAEVDGFVRGFVRTVADALGLDPDETLNRTRSEPSQSSDAGGRFSLRRVGAVVAVVVALALALGLVQAVAIAPSAPSPPAPTDERVVRLDPVRALAEAGAGTLERAPAPVPVPAAPPDPSGGEWVAPRVEAAATTGR